MFSTIYPTAAGVQSLNALGGALTLVAGSGITITPAGANITIAASGGGSGANTALSNLASTAVNTTIAPDTNQNWDLGATGLLWGTVWASALNSDGALSLSSAGAGISLSALNGIDISSNTGLLTFGTVGNTTSSIVIDPTKGVAISSLGNAFSGAVTGPGIRFYTAGGNSTVGELDLYAVGTTSDGYAFLYGAALNLQSYYGGNVVELQFNEDTNVGNEYIAFKAPTTVTATYKVVWPATQGTAGQSLKIASVAGNVLTLQWA